MHWPKSKLWSTRIRNRGLSHSVRLATYQLADLAQYGSPIKLANILAAKAHKWLRHDTIHSMPYCFYLDPINICNLKCPLCPTGQGIIGRPRGKLDFENFTYIVDQVAKYAYLMDLYNWGEPFLHPKIFDMITYAHARHIVTRLSSNLNFFDESMADKTVAAGLDQLFVSIDGSTPDTYGKYRVGGDLDKVLQNIRLLVTAKEKQHRRRPRITARMLVNRYNEQQVRELRKMVEDLGVDAFSTAPIFIDTAQAAQHDWLPLDEAQSAYRYTAEGMENAWHCGDLWERMTISWDGGVAPCCWPHRAQNDFANIFEKTIAEIWNGDAYISARRVFASGRPRSGLRPTICAACQGRPRYLID